jgi:hypothetical protein
MLLTVKLKKWIGKLSWCCVWLTQFVGSNLETTNDSQNCVNCICMHKNVKSKSVFDEFLERDHRSPVGTFRYVHFFLCSTQYLVEWFDKTSIFCAILTYEEASISSLGGFGSCKKFGKCVT